MLGVSKELRWRVFIPQPALGLVNVEFHKKGWPGLRERGDENILVSKVTSSVAQSKNFTLEPTEKLNIWLIYDHMNHIFDIKY